MTYAISHKPDCTITRPILHTYFRSRPVDLCLDCGRAAYQDEREVDPEGLLSDLGDE